MCQIETRILWAIATAARIFPRLAVSRRYFSARYVLPRRRQPEIAADTSAVFRKTFPFRLFPERFLPALSLFPGQRPAQACPCEVAPRAGPHRFERKCSDCLIACGVGPDPDILSL